MVVVLSRRPWAGVRATDEEGEPLEIPLRIDRKFGDAFLPVFEDEAEARALYPECDVLELHFKPVQAVLHGGRSEEQP